MIIATVSRNSLFAELLCKACEDENTFILKKTDHLSNISETEDSIIVLLHIGASDTVETVGLTDFRHAHPTARVIVIAENDLSQTTVEDFGQNAEAVVQADLSAKALLGFISVVHAGFQVQKCPEDPSDEVLIVPSQPDQSIPEASRSDQADALFAPRLGHRLERQKKPNIRLSDREREIMNLLAHGSSNKEIAKRLDIVENTVKVHLRSCYSKIGVRNRTQAALWSTRNL
jgi:DNA-binding NarL/FixJ family response regulator